MPPKICGNSTGKIPDTVLIEGIAIRFGCQHGLRLTYFSIIVRYYNALWWMVVPPHSIESPSKSTTYFIFKHLNTIS